MIHYLQDPETSDPIFRVIIHSHHTKKETVYDFLGIPSKKFTAESKDWNNNFPTNVSQCATFMEEYPQTSKLFWKKNRNSEYHWIKGRIRLDDSITQIKQKIIYAMGSVNGVANLATPNQIEIWVDIPSDATWGNENREIKALRIGDRFENFEDHISWTSQQIDSQNFLTPQGRPRTDLTPLEENDRLLENFLSEISKPLELPILHVHLLSDAWDAWIRLSRVKSEMELNTYFFEYWPFGDTPPKQYTTKDVYLQYQAYVNYDNQLFRQLSDIPLEPELAPDGCLIEKIEFIINSQLTGERVELLKFFNSIELDLNTVFKRYRDPEQIHPKIVIYEPAVKQKRISPKRLQDWLYLQGSQNPRSRESRISAQRLTIKRFIYEGSDGPRYATIHFTTDGQYTIDLHYKSMSRGGATPTEVALNLKEIREWIQSAQNTFDIRAHRSPTLPKEKAIPLLEYTFDETTKEFTWGQNMGIISLTLLLVPPIKHPWTVKLDKNDNDLKKQLSYFPLMLIPDLRSTIRQLKDKPANPGDAVVYRYTRIPNYLRMNDLFSTIQETILMSSSLERTFLIQKILIQLSEQHSITLEEALRVWQEWDEKYGFTLTGQANCRLRQIGLVTRFSSRKLELTISRAGFWLGQRALSLLFRIWIQFIKKIPFRAEFNDSFVSMSDNLDTLMKKEDAELRKQTIVGIGTHISTFYQANEHNLEKINSIMEEELSDELVQRFLMDSESLERDFQAEKDVAIRNISNENISSLSPPDGYLANPEDNPFKYKDINLDVICPSQEEIDPKSDTCTDFCDDVVYTLRRLQRYDQALFKVDKRREGFKHSYSQSCQRSTMQPIVTIYNPELHPNVDRSSFSYAIRYGTLENRQNYYWCPQVWCPYEEIAIPYDRVKDKLVTRVTKTKKRCVSALCPSCVENFKRERWLRIIPTDDYHPYPGFIDPTKHPQNFCMVCCYKKSSQDLQYSLYKRYKKCIKDTDDGDEKKESRDYIMSREKIPLPADRFGHLTLNLSNLLKSNCSTSYLKSGDMCLLRRGVSKTMKQPLLELVHYLDNIKDCKEPEWVSTSAPAQQQKGPKIKPTKTPTLLPENIISGENTRNQKETAEKKGIDDKNEVVVTSFIPYQTWIKEWVKRIPIDVFPTLSRGKLVRYFRPDPIPVEWITLSDAELRKKVNTSAYESFIDFLSNPSERVSIELLWDWLQRPGTLHKDGVNIFIFRGNEILCPYTEDIDDLYKPNRPNVFLFTNYDQTLFEPIVYLINKRGKYYVTQFSQWHDENVKRIFQYLRKSCQSRDRISWERIRKEYSPSVALSKNKIPLPTYHERINQIPEKNRTGLVQYVDWNGHVLGFILPIGVLMPMRPASIHAEFPIVYELPQVSFIDAKKYYEKAAKDWNDNSMNPVQMILSENKKQVIGILLQSEIPIPVKHIDIDKLKKGEILPESQFYTCAEINRRLFDGSKTPDSRIVMTARQSFLEETYERVRFELSRALGERPAIQQRIRQLIYKENISLSEKKKILIQILEPILEKYISREAQRGDIDLVEYIPPNLRQRCSSLVTPHTSEKAAELCQETPHCRYNKPHKRCQLWIPNLEVAFSAESHQTTRQKLISRLLEEFLRNPWKRDEVLENRMEDLLDRHHIQLKKNEVLMQGDVTALREQYITFFRPPKISSSRFNSPIWNTAHPKLNNTDLERYRIHLPNRTNAIRTFLPTVTDIPNTIYDIVGKGYRMRASDAKSDHFFYALRGSAEDVVISNLNNDESGNWVTWNSSGNANIPWNGDTDIWKKWYREQLEEIRVVDIEKFIETLKAQSLKNKENPLVKQLEEGLAGIYSQIKERGSENISLTLLHTVISIIFTPLRTKSLSSWSDVQLSLDRGDYPISAFDFFLLHRILGFHVLVFERRHSLVHPRGYTLYRAGSLNAPVWVVYQYSPDVFLHVNVIEYKDHLLLPIPTFMSQTQKWILDKFKEVPVTDIWSEEKRINPWMITQTVSWDLNTLREWKRELK